MVKEFPELKSKVLLAPMADITNLAFRIMCKDYGAGLVSTELLSANALAKKNKLVLKLAKTDKKERPVVAQLFSDNIDNFVKSAKILQKDFDIIDLNFGCPAKRITEQGSGSALLKDPKKIGEIVKAVCENVGVPVTVKIRIGTNKKRINAVEVAKICESNGASAVIIHGRTVDQGYSGKVDLEIIKKVKQAVKIPVIGNGNITDGASAKKMLEETGCDYVMIGRASIGNPFIFKEINKYLKTGKRIKQTPQEKIEDFFRYLELTKKLRMFSIKDAKRNAQYFTKGFDGSTNFRREIQQIESEEELNMLIRKLIINNIKVYK